MYKLHVGGFVSCIPEIGSTVCPILLQLQLQGRRGVDDLSGGIPPPLGFYCQKYQISIFDVIIQFCLKKDVTSKLLGNNSTFEIFYRRIKLQSPVRRQGGGVEMTTATHGGPKTP